MSWNSYNQTLISAQGDGSALTAAAAASMLPGQAKFTFPASYLKIGDVFHVTASGRISCVVTTPGTARYDWRWGPTSNIVVFDSQAMNLNTTAQTTVGWWLDFICTCRSVGSGTSATFFGSGLWSSIAIIASPAAAAGAPGAYVLPYNTTPAAGTGFDSTVSNVWDSFFTQTVATGSMTAHQYRVVYET
jgi:hypothetical protein